MNLFNLIENTTGGYDNLRALLQAVSTRSPAELNIGGDPITLDYMEANFLNGIYRAYLKAGRQEEFIQDLGDARRFDMHMKKLRDLIAKQKSFRGSVPGQRGVTGDVPAGVMEGLVALEEIAMQDPNNPTDQNAGKLNWTRMIQDYMGNKPYTEFEFGTDRPLTLYRTQIYAILKAFGNMKPQQKLNIILNTFGNKVATVEYLDKLRAKGMMPKKVPAYVAPGTEAPAPGQMSLPGIDMPRIKEAQKKSPQELARDTAVSAKVQRAFQLARARQPAAASDIEAFVKDEIERGEELAQQVGQLQQDNEQQSQQIAQLTKAVSQQAKAEPEPLPSAPSAPAARAPTAPAKPVQEPTAKAEPETLPKDKEEPKTEPKAEPAPQTRPAPAKARKPRAKPRAKSQKAPVELPPVDTTIQMPPQQIPDQRPSAQILQFPGGRQDPVGAAMQGLDLGDLPRAAGQNESVRVTVRGNPLFEGKDGTVKQRIADDFFLVDVDGFGSHAFHVSKLVFEMQTRLDRFNIDRPMLPSGVAKVQYARDNNMYDDARLQGVAEGTNDFSRNIEAFRVYQHLDPMEFYNFANTPRGLQILAQKAGTTPESVKDSLERMDWGQFPAEFYQDPEDDGQDVSEAKARYEMTDPVPGAAPRGRGRPPGIKHPIDYIDNRDDGQPRIGRVEKTATGIRHLARPERGGVVPTADPLATLDKSTTNRLDRAFGIKWPKEKKWQSGIDLTAMDSDQPGVAEGFLGDREYNRVMPFVKRMASEVSDYDRDEFGEELWSLLDQKYGSKFAQSVLQDSLDFYWDEYAELVSQQGVAEGTDDVKKRMSKLEALALAANRAGDDAKCKMYQQKIQSLKQKLSRDMSTGVAEAVTDVKAGMAEIYHRLAPKIERHRDSFLAGQLYDELENYAELHGAEGEFKRMMAAARNSAHMEYDTNPGGFHNWFWFLPFENEKLDEKKDACYTKVKSRYKVWPSAYASGALVQCRKKGADNWGTGGKKKK